MNDELCYIFVGGFGSHARHCDSNMKDDIGMASHDLIVSPKDFDLHDYLDVDASEVGP